MSKEVNREGYRLAHTMIRVRDLEASFNFYCKTLGMKIFLMKTKNFQESNTKNFCYHQIYQLQFLNLN